MASKTDVSGMAEDELHQGLTESKKEYLNLRFQQATGQLDNTARVRQVRRQIARIKTRLTALAKGTASAKAGGKS